MTNYQPRRDRGVDYIDLTDDDAVHVTYAGLAQKLEFWITAVIAFVVVATVAVAWTEGDYSPASVALGSLFLAWTFNGGYNKGESK